MGRRRTDKFGWPVLALRAPPAQVSDIMREARKRKITKSQELRRRLDFYAAAQRKLAKSATAIAT